MRIFVQSSGHRSLTGVTCLCTGISVQSCGHPSLTGTMCYIGIGPCCGQTVTLNTLYLYKEGSLVLSFVCVMFTHILPVCHVHIVLTSTLKMNFLQESTRTAQKWSALVVYTRQRTSRTFELVSACQIARLA